MSTATIEQPTATPAIKFDASIVGFNKSPKGEWRLVGPVSLVTEGLVTITKKNGNTSVEYVVGVGATFDRGGVQSRYGYLKTKEESREPKPAATATASAAPKSSEADFVPDDFEPAGDVEDPAAWDF